jgi:endonuclease-3
MARSKNLAQRARRMSRVLRAAYPDAKTALRFSSPFELLIATILSAQCTDERVNTVTVNLFRKYRKPEDYYRVPAAELEADIRPTGFFRNKTRSIQACCRSLVEKFTGKVPDTIDEMTRLEGVGRKTANVILGEAFGKPAIAVDTHVRRLTARLELSAETDPDKIEINLKALLPEREWTHFANAMIWHGRRICVARKPRCFECVIRDDCPFPNKTKQKISGK